MAITAKQYPTNKKITSPTTTTTTTIITPPTTTTTTQTTLKGDSTAIVAGINLSANQLRVYGTNSAGLLFEGGAGFSVNN